MALTDSFPGPSGLTDSIEAGKDIAALLRHNVDGTPRAGLTWKPAGNLVTSRSDLRVNIAPFKAALVRANAARLIANDASDQSPDLTVPAANSRIDVLYVKVGEMSQGDAADGPFFGILVGTPGAIPAKPVLAIDGALELASILIPSTATATNSAGVTITQSAPTTGPVGIPTAFAAGVIGSAVIVAAGNVDTPVTFPTGRFSVPPIVTVSLNGVRDLTVSYKDVTTSGFTLVRASVSAVSRTSPQASWHAIQMTDAAAAG